MGRPGARLKQPAMRVDVKLAAGTVASELAQLQGRLPAPREALHALPCLPAPLPGLVFRYREADGEFYLYVQDAASGALAGYTVFCRVAELGRTAGRYLRAPHSRYAEAYQRRGIATAVYQWALNAGLCLLSGPRQSAGAHALWRSLATHYELGYVRVREQALAYLGDQVEPAVLQDFHTRMVLFAGGWEPGRLRSRCRD